jgi:H+-translocating NAD(P) transhydrogenase subunit alpha
MAPRAISWPARDKEDWLMRTPVFLLPFLSLLTAASAAAAEAPIGQAGGQPLDLMSMLFVFMLATFIGFMVISRVSRLLHTPLMSLTNAISAIAVVGAILVTGSDHPPLITLLGAIALFASMTNIVSGFLITDRMLKMFKTRDGGRP